MNKSIAADKANYLLAGYVCAAVLFVAAMVALQSLTWQGSRELHTIMEVLATTLAGGVGTLALIRYYSRKSNMYLLVGTGFLGTALLDGYHSVVTSSFFHELLPSPPPSLIPWSWNASRTFLAVMMFLGWLAWRWEKQHSPKEDVAIRESRVYGVVAAMTFTTFCFFAFVPLPRAYYPEFFFGRPEEFLAGAMFLVSLCGFSMPLRNARSTVEEACETRTKQTSDVFESWLIASLLVGVVCQSVVMSRSFSLFDLPFDLAHALKIVSYLLVLVGSLVDTFRLFQRVQSNEAILLQQTAMLAAGKATAVELLHDARRAEEELKQANASLQRSNSELEQFAYVASHDLQEPLRKVSSFCSLLEKEYGDRLEGDGITYVRYAVDGAARMKSLIQDLLAYSRIHSKGQELEQTDTAKILARVLDDLEWSIEDAQATVTFAELPPVLADQTQLIHLLQNLIGNAIKYRGDTAPEIHVGVEPHASDWLFSVADNGIGIAPEFHQRIFGIFKRLHARDDYPGTGIGLAICERIVERLGGRIWVESNEGQGSTFYFTVPIPETLPLEGATANEHSEPTLASTY